MPASSWFHKLRGRSRGKGKRSAACPSPTRGSSAGAIAFVAASAEWTDAQTSQHCRPPAACAGYSPNRASYYFPSADGALRCIAPRGGADDDGAALDVRVDVIHRRAGRLGGVDAPPATPELNLRRIVTRPAVKNDPAESVAISSSASTPTSAATTPSTCRARGFHVKPASRRRRRRGQDDQSARKEKAAEDAGSRRRQWLYESLVVVKTSSDPEREMAESMAEMVAANHIRSSVDLEELLACYLALNAAEHHRAVVAAFRRVWLHIAGHKMRNKLPALQANYS